ncbi:PC-esterase [Parasitella parasitica]|nr:PC-esterase [Parasitella parasitica]
MDTKKLADHFVDHPILFVGDSITQLQFESLGCLLGEHLPNRHPANSNLNGGNSKIHVDAKAPEHKDTAAMAYIRSDYLLRLDDYKMISPFESVGTQLGRGENHPWVHALSQFNYIIINTGPHWHPDLFWGSNQSEQELLDAFRKAMESVLFYLDQHVKPHQKVWVRTTPYGHARCSQYKEPQENPLAPTGNTGEYEWHLFQEFDAVWKDLLRKQDDRFALFDIFGMSNMRGDAHSKPDRDCLHTCIPGPIDEWNRLLYNEIMRQIK